MRAVLAGSRLPVLRAPFLTLTAVAVVLVAGTVHLLDDGYALTVVRGVTVVLAAALALTTDDPAGEVLAAAPVPRATRTLARVAVGLAVVVPVWVVSVALARWRAEPTPVAGLALEAAALAVAAVAAGAVLRARGTTAPSWLALIALAAGMVALYTLPVRFGMAVTQTWGPPWQAAQLRWAAVLVLATAVLILALRDPLATLRQDPGPAAATPPAGNGGTTRAARPVAVR